MNNILKKVDTFIRNLMDKMFPIDKSHHFIMGVFLYVIGLFCVVGGMKMFNINIDKIFIQGFLFIFTATLAFLKEWYIDKKLGGTLSERDFVATFFGSVMCILVDIGYSLI